MGFSTSGAHLVVFAAVLLSASTFVGTFDASVDRAMGGASASFQDRTEQLRTDIAINRTHYDPASDRLAFNVTNTGSRVLSVNATDVLIDNEYYGLEDLARRAVGGNGSARLWLPGENMTYVVSLTEAPDSIKVVTEHGVAAARVFRKPELETETDPRWLMFAKHANNTGFTTADAPTENVTIRWNVSTGGRVRASPVLLARSTTGTPDRHTRTTVYVGSKDNYLYSIDADDGFVRWREDLGGAVETAATIDGDVVVAFTANGTAVGMDEDNGTRLWETVLPNSPDTPAPGTVYRGRVYIHDSRGNVSALFPSNGTIDWTNKVGQGARGPPAAVDGTVFVTDDNNEVIAINASDGTVQWREQYDKQPDSGPAIEDGVIYFGSTEKKAYAIATNGTRLWQWSPKKGGAGFPTVPAITNDTVYIANDQGRIHAIWANNGSGRWTFEPAYSTKYVLSPTVAAGTVYVGDDDGNVTALYASNGSVRWYYQLSDTNVRSSPAIVGGRIYLGVDDGSVFALDPVED